MSTFDKIYEANGWKVISYGRGWAYSLVDTTSNKSAWFQDDDARAFEANTMDQECWVGNVEERFADYSDVMQNIQ